MGLFGRRRTDATAPADPRSRSGLVVPLLAGEAWLAANRETFARAALPEHAHPFARPFLPGLWVTYATDPAGSWDLVQNGQVESFGGVAALDATARENLAVRAADATVDARGGRVRVTVAAEPDLAASLLLVPDRWRGALGTAAAVVAVPTRAVLLACEASDRASVAALADLAQAMFDEADGKPVAPGVLTLPAVG